MPCSLIILRNKLKFVKVIIPFSGLKSTKSHLFLKIEYERVFNQVKDKYKQKMDKLRFDMEEKRKLDTEAIEKKKDDQIEAIQNEHI